MREKLLRALALFVGAVACSFPVAAQWTNGQNAEYVVGQPDFVSNGSAGSQNELRNPQGVAVDVTNGKLYVADEGNHRVLQFGASGTLPVELAVFGVE